MSDTITKRCSGGCGDELELPAVSSPVKLRYEATLKGWRSFTPRLNRQPMATVYTCPLCVRAGR